ncbi:unnamed protein product [Brugia timori]|uniref:Response regulatory domain-containing protein n=1 Tax=Brugia timori TaxID=42155 RepID=A0A0R3Q7I0_9BILA|nr:unnamed protein product [Brugia timori]
MKSGTSRLFELLPDPYDISQRRFFRVCLFTDVKNASELRQALVDGSIDAALIKPELQEQESLMFIEFVGYSVHSSIG